MNATQTPEDQILIPAALDTERTDLLAVLASRRHFLRFAVRDLSDEQARLRPTASQLCLGGLIKHVAATEAGWLDFAVRGAAAMPDVDEAVLKRWASQWEMLPQESLSDLLAQYEDVARRTDEVVAGLPDLNQVHALPKAPWFEPGASWSNRKVLLHVIAETAHHSGHADIIRETIDGAKTMA